jgi:hypothetical protein
MKQKQTYPITTEIDGKTYSGSRLVEGTSKLFQTISYRDRSRFDGHQYKPSEAATMESIARIILGELVRESNKSNY